MAAFRETETKFIIEFKFVMDGSTVKSVDLSRRNMPGPMQQNGISKEAWNIFIEELDELAKKHPLVGKNKDSRASTAVYWTLVVSSQVKPSLLSQINELCSCATYTCNLFS